MIRRGAAPAILRERSRPLKLSFVPPSNLAEYLTLGSAIGIVAVTGVWLLVAGLSHVDAGWTRALVGWLVEDLSFDGFTRDVVTSGPLAGIVVTLLLGRARPD